MHWANQVHFHQSTKNWLWRESIEGRRESIGDVAKDIVQIDDVLNV